MGILKFIFIIFLGTFCLGEVVRFNLGNNFFIKPVDVSLGLLLLSWIFVKSKELKSIVLKDTIFLPLAIFVGSLLLSVILNAKNLSDNQMLIAFSYIARWIMYSSLFFITKSFPLNFKEKALSFIAWMGIVIVFFGFIQYLFYSNLRNLYYLGWDEHMYRMFSTFLDPNFAGAIFVALLIFILGMLLFFLKNNKRNFSLIMIIFFVFTTFSVLLSYSRSALIMLLIGASIFAILTKKKYWILAVFLTLIIFIFVSSRNFNIENINLFRIASSEARIDSAKIALNIIKDSPVVGVGFNAYRYAQVRYGFRKEGNAALSHADAGTDNSFLFILATSGVVGFILYLNLFKSILSKAYFVYKNTKDRNVEKYLAIILISTLGALTVDSFFINSLFYPFTMMWMWILLGFMEKK